MNLLQEKVAALKQRGDLNRSRWNPADIPVLSGWPLRSYHWWQQETGYRGSENLCHFVRVALFWAPLRWVTQPLRWAAKSLRRAFGSALVPLFVGILAVMLLANEVLLVHRHGLGPVLIGNAFFIGAVAAVWGIVRLVRRYKRQINDALGWFTEASPNRLPWLRPWIIVPVVLICLAPFVPAVLTLLVLVGFVASLLGIFAGVGWLAHRIETARRQREENVRKEAFLRELFAQLHPTKVGNQQIYEAWRERYIQWRLVQQSADVSYNMLTDFSALSWRAYPQHSRARIAIRERELALQQANRVPKRPSRVRRAFTGVGQFFALIWTFIVIKKWKICPIIQLPDERSI